MVKQIFPKSLRFAPVLILWLLSGCANGSSGISNAAVPTPVVSASATPVPTPSPAAPIADPVFYTYKVVKSYPHDRTAYTQGLVVRDGIFYESTGLYGESSLRKAEIETGKVVKKTRVPNQYFAEGMTEMGGKLYQLTWQEGTGFIYDKETFKKTGEFQYEGEGWGLTDNGKELILSDGTETIRFLDPKTFAVKRTITVNTGVAGGRMNELEYIDGEIWANIYQYDSIIRINPKDGTVTGTVDMTHLLPDSERRSDTDVLNGIAYDSEKKRLFVTGKRWPKVYQIEVTKQ